MSRAPKTRRLTRRSVIAAGLTVAAYEAAARPLILRGGEERTAGAPPPPPPSSGLSRTYLNTAATATPANWAVEVMMVFAPGEVPATSIAEPTVGGIVQTYNVSQLSLQHWGDGSLQLAKYYISRSTALGAGQYITFEFEKKIGSFITTTAINEGHFVSETDFRFKLSNVHTAGCTPSESKFFAITIDNASGTISGGKAIQPTNLTMPATNILYGSGAGSGSGVGGQISFSNGVPTVVNPGSGYSHVGAGTFEALFNNVIAAAASGGNFANGVAWEWVGRGAACDEIKATAVMHASLPHYHVRFYIRRWKKPDGSLLTYSFDMRGNLGLVDPALLHDYTFDIDIYERNTSTTAIRGASVGTATHQSVYQNVASGLFSFNDKAEPDWLANGNAYNAIKMVLTPDECRYLWHTRVLPPYSTVDSTGPVPTTFSEFNVGGSPVASGVMGIGRYRPTGTFGMRNGAQEAAAESNLFGPGPEVCQRYWLACYHERPTEALTWLNNIRVTAACSSAVANMGGGSILEPTTTYLPNTVSPTVHVFPGMVPNREFSWPQPPTMNFRGSAHPIGFGIVGGGGSVPLSSTHHQSNITFQPYILLGNEWLRDNIIYAGTVAVHGLNYLARKVTMAGRVYYGTMVGGQGVTANVRGPAWYQYSLGLATRVAAEGSIERQYCEYIADGYFSYLNDLPPFIGTFQHGGHVRTKSLSFANSGLWPDQFFPEAVDIFVSYMDDYAFQADVVLTSLFRDSPLGAKIKAFRDYRSNFYVARFAGPGNIYYSQNGRGRSRTHTSATLGGPVDFRRGVDADNPGYGIAAFDLPGGGQNVFMSVTNGSDIIKLVGLDGATPLTITLYGTTQMPSGSRIALTQTNLRQTTLEGIIPAGFTEGQHYYWLGLTPTTGKLCTDAALTNPVVSLQTHPVFPVDSAGLAPPAQKKISFFVIPTVGPLVSAGRGTHSSGPGPGGYTRVSSALGILRMARALALPTDNNTELDLAISRLGQVWSSIPGNSYGDAIRTNLVTTPPA